MAKKADYQVEYYSKDHSYLNYKDTHFVDHVVYYTINETGIKKKDKILEVGAGSGRFTIPLLKKGYSIMVLELSKHMIQKLKAAAGPCQKKVSIVNQDLALINRRWYNQFDVILGFHILHHLDDLPTCFSNIYKMLKPKGRIMFTEPNIWNPLYYVQLLVEKDMSWEGEKGYLNLRKNYLRKLLQSAGFPKIRFIRYGVLPHFLMNRSWGPSVENKLEKIPLAPIKLYLCIEAEK